MRMKLPAAAPITLAFHVRMNIAPAPYKKLNSMQKISTLTLFRNILLSSAVCVIWPVTCWFRFVMVCDCTLNSPDATSEGRALYQKENAIAMPANSIR